MPDREKVIKAIEDCAFHKNDCVDCYYDGCVFEHGDCRRDMLADALSMLKEQPEIVRCKDCRWGERSRNGKGEEMIFCYNGDTGIEDGYLHEPDWFCAEGERK